ncbi:MAG: serine/threonine protein kinase [Cyanobacteria bacterium Co-bin8]|nr:serine/threonine protein kinase [Cyanobacteria bacterium Co-bin8]
MEIFCTRPSCPRPVNVFPDLDSGNTIKTVQQKFCMTCGMPLLLGSRYLPQKLLGQGGFGTAFLARDRYTPTLRSCVVKLFQPTGQLSPAQLQTAQDLFEREAAVLEELGNHHPQIPNLYAFFSLQVSGLRPGVQEEYFYLVQEFIDGQNLEQLLEQNGAFTEAEVQEILVSLLKVLEFVHQHGTIHRDIKPSNIMRDRNQRLYLLDFGAVKQVAKAGSPNLKSTGIYSMGYAPPEQMAGGAVYPATDLYALAVTCISLLTGKPPEDLYDGYQNSWKWEQYATVKPVLAQVLNRLLAPAPQQRYDSAAEALAALAGPVSPPAPMPSPTPPPTPLQPAPSSSPPAVAKVPGTPASAPATQPFSLAQFLGGALFTGFEGGLLVIASLSLLGTTLMGSGAWLLLLGVLVLLQLKRTIERLDLVIIAAVTLAMVLLFPPLRSVLAGFSTPLQWVLALAIMAGLMAAAIATLFRLLFRLFS